MKTIRKILKGFPLKSVKNVVFYSGVVGVFEIMENLSP
jgi:hypothetical protein